MEINKDHIVAGIIGGVVAFGLQAAAAKFGLMGTSSSSKAIVTIMKSDKVPQAIGPYVAGRTVTIGGSQFGYFSGQIGMDPKKMEIVSADIKDQTEQALINLKNLANDNGFTFEHAIKNNLYITDMANFADVNDVYKKYFTETNGFPARTCVAVKQLPKDSLFEIESVFFKP